MWNAIEEGVPRDEHFLRALSALAEAHGELVARVTAIERGPQGRESPRKPQDP